MTNKDDELLHWGMRELKRGRGIKKVYSDILGQGVSKSDANRLIKRIDARNTAESRKGTSNAPNQPKSSSGIFVILGIIVIITILIIVFYPNLINMKFP